MISRERGRIAGRKVAVILGCRSSAEVPQPVWEWPVEARLRNPIGVRLDLARGQVIIG